MTSPPWLTSITKLVEREPEWSWRDAEARDAAAGLRDLITLQLQLSSQIDQARRELALLVLRTVALSATVVAGMLTIIVVL